MSMARSFMLMLALLWQPTAPANAYCVRTHGYEVVFSANSCTPVVPAVVARSSTAALKFDGYVAVLEDGSQKDWKEVLDGVVLEGDFRRVCKFERKDPENCAEISSQDLRTENTVPESRIIAHSIQSCSDLRDDSVLELRILPPCCDELPPTRDAACYLRAFETEPD